ncbi:hypothetical protein FA13DRAFT_677125 [Coprinellus micaceus]|uniref:Uncharacterized protein n=1 Tax=Coprinellus micaceus TaxID=71717 RepID=A0A4Y7SAN2_COPMI|nr:hypothetical protein FA13DRAFT_677125 [Coprinellus micaceus]
MPPRSKSIPKLLRCLSRFIYRDLLIFELESQSWRWHQTPSHRHLRRPRALHLNDSHRALIDASKFQSSNSTALFYLLLTPSRNVEADIVTTTYASPIAPYLHTRCESPRTAQTSRNRHTSPLTLPLVALTLPHFPLLSLSFASSELRNPPYGKVIPTGPYQVNWGVHHPGSLHTTPPSMLFMQWRLVRVSVRHLDSRRRR